MDSEKAMITLPPECIDPKGLKIGQHISTKIEGTVKRIDEEFGVTIELGDGEESLEDFESMDDEGQKKKIKKQFDKNNPLEEY